MPAQLDIKPPAKYIGLDADQKSVKLVELQDSPQGLTLTKFAIEAVEKKDSLEALTASIKKVFAAQAIEGKEIYAAISGLAVSIRRIRIPEMPESEIQGAIKWEAKNYLPFPIENIHIDYSLLGKIKEQNVSKLDVLAVAVPREEMNKHINSIEAAGLKVLGLTIAPFAIWDLLNSSIKATNGETIAVIEMGCETSSINLFKDNTLQFTREISVAGESFTKCLTGTIVADNFQLNLNREQAEAIKIKHGIPKEDEEGKTEEGVPLSQVRAAVKPTLRRFINEIQRSFDYYKEQFLEEKIHRVYLSGGSSLLKNLDAFLGESFDIPIEIINPFQNIKISPELNSKVEEIKALAPRLMLATSLAAGKTKGLNLIKGQLKKKKAKTKDPSAKAAFDWSNLKTSLKLDNLAKNFENIPVASIILVALLVLLIVGAFGYNFYLQNQINYFKSELDSKKLALADLKSLLNRRMIVKKISAEETKVRETLGKLVSLIPADVVLDSLTYINETRAALITGTCSDIKTTGNLLKTIESSPYFSKAQLKEAKKISATSTEDDEEDITVSFSLSFHVD